MIKKIENGEYDGHQIEVEKEDKVEGPVIEVFANAPGEEDGMSDLLESIMSTLPGGKKKKKKMAVEHAVDYILRSEVEKSIDLDELIPEAISKVEEDGIVFIDEIDKIAEREGNSRGEVSRQGVQRDILPLVEGTTVMTKYGPVKTDHILFIAAGAFTLSSPSDLMPELQGRFPVRVKLKSLEKEDFIKILTQVEYNLIEQYKNLLKVDNVELDFTKQAIEAIADVAIELNESIENIGARRLASVIETVLRELMYEAPYSELIKEKIGKKDVEKVFKIDAEEENLDKYIL
jgi:ATP-dependent HslUV protease ATP-binding subunit HslU